MEKRVKRAYVSGSGAQASDIAEALLPVAQDIEHLDQSLRASERSNRKLSQWLIAFTVVLVVLTAVIAWFTVLLAVRH